MSYNVRDTPFVEHGPIHQTLWNSQGLLNVKTSELIQHCM